VNGKGLPISTAYRVNRSPPPHLDPMPGRTIA